MSATLEDRIDAAARALGDQVVTWRRSLHRRPELAFGEFQTAAMVIDALSDLPFVRLNTGRAAQDLRLAHTRNLEFVEAAAERALAAGVDADRVDTMRREGTAVVAEIGSGNGPVVGFRVDMDALPINEAEADHLPAAAGFRSDYDGLMHACGHDGHTAIGLALASALSAVGSELPGRVRIFFQPAEEGTMGGAASMLDSPLVSELDAMIPIHIGLGTPSGSIIAAASFMATTKYVVEFRGPPGAHVVAHPEAGANAMMAAAATVQMLNALPPHSGGWYNLNVGVLRSGDDVGILPHWATMHFGFWAESQPVHDFVAEQAQRIVRGCAAAAGCTAGIRVLGRAPSAIPDLALASRIDAAAIGLGLRTTPPTLIKAGEDATEFMNAVTSHGGRASMIVLGSDLAANHHHARFDFDERVLLDGTRLLARVALNLMDTAA